jgi:hypothetical protein
MPATSRTDFESAVDVEELTAEQGVEMFDRVARQELGISGEEFLRRWDAGDYADSEDMGVTRLYMLMPFAR